MPFTFPMEQWPFKQDNFYQLIDQYTSSNNSVWTSLPIPHLWGIFVANYCLTGLEQFFWLKQLPIQHYGIIQCHPVLAFRVYRSKTSSVNPRFNYSNSTSCFIFRLVHRLFNVFDLEELTSIKLSGE